MECMYYDSSGQPKAGATAAEETKGITKREDCNSRVNNKHRKWNLFLLLGADLLLHSTTTHYDNFLYSAKQLPPAKNEYSWLWNVITSIWYGSTLIGGLLADSFLGRFQHVVGSIAVLSVIYFGMAAGTVRLPGLGWTGLDVSAIMFHALLTGNISGSLSALIGDQTTSDGQRRSSFVLFYLTSSLGYIFVYFFSKAAVANACLGAEKCYFIPYTAGCLFAAGIVMVLHIFKRQMVKQATCQLNILTTLYMMLKYSIVMRLSADGTGIKKSVFEYAEELDRKTAMDLRRLSRSLFFIVILVFYNWYHLTALSFSRIQALDMNPYAKLGVFETIGIERGSMFIAGVCILAYVYFFPKSFGIMGAMKVTALIITTASLVTLALEARISFGCVKQPGEIQLGVINSLNCSVTVYDRENGNKNLIRENEAKGFTNKLSDLAFTVHSECSSDGARNPNLSAIVLNASDALVTVFYWHNHSINHVIYPIGTSELRRKTLLIGNDPNLKVVQDGTEIKRVDITPVGSSKSTLFKWFVEATTATSSLQVSLAEVYIERLIDVASTYFVLAINDRANLVEIVPGCRPTRALILIPKFMITFVGALFHLLFLEFTYTQAPARLRAVLFGLVLCSGVLSSIIDIYTQEATEIRSDGKLINFGVVSFLTVIAWVYAIWKLDKIGLCELEPVEDEKEG